MPETPEQLSHHEAPPIDSQTVEVLRAKLLEAEKRERNKATESLSTDGVTADAAKLFEKVRNVHRNDSESGMHSEIPNMPMPLHAKDHRQALDLVNSLIDTAKGDPYDEINMLGEENKP